jgi:hypothetical protein
MNLSTSQQAACRQLDTYLPATDGVERTATKERLVEVQAQLLMLRSQYKTNSC